MTPERWQQIEQLLHATLELEDEHRAAYLARACAGDEALRHKVEALLSHQEEAEDFIETPALQVAARALANDRSRLLTNRQIKHYRILSRLGAGGMGEVYLALDTKLDRKVALKLLPAQFTQDAERVRRFDREARAASALNHPNIITIHEIGQASSEEGGQHFIATEFVEGRTLRQLMADGRMKLPVVLGVAAQVASALASAHAAGIVHRDIKPENIMLRPDGYVKVLDFGLAKLTESQASKTDAQAMTLAATETEPGRVMGTAQYMSPEQARGLKVDARSDVFSLGVVLYEMIAGRPPFAGATPSDVLAAILTTEPPPLSHYLPEATGELDRIVMKALGKDREGRYQSAGDLLPELKNIRHELETGSEKDRVTTASRGAVTTSSAEYLVNGIRRHKRAAIAVLTTLIIAAAAISYFVWKNKSGAGADGAIDSIAVLPFLNASADQDSEILSDGITESIINSLSQLSQLRVVARTTVFRYKGQVADPQKVGRELGVRAVLTGKVVRRGETLSIQADLMNIASGSQLWGDHFNRSLADIFAVQDEIAKQISEKLRLRLTSEEQRRLTKRYTENTEAYQLYLRGRFWEDRRTEEGFKKAIGYFNQAIEKDPGYALAWVGLAGSNGGLSDHGFLAPKEGFEKAKDAIRKALEFDDQLAEAHTEMAADLCFYDWDFAGAEPEYKRAIELNPNSASGHYLYGSYLSIVGRHAEAVAEKRRAQELEPSSVINNFGIGWALCRARQYDQAIETLRQTLEMDRNFGHTWRFLGLAYMQKGMPEEAISNLREAVRLTPEHTGFIASLGCAYARAGRKGEALTLLAELKQLSTSRFVGAYDLAMIYAGLGDKDQALAQLELAYAGRSNQLVYLTGEPAWETIRSDARFAGLVRRIGLPS